MSEETYLPLLRCAGCTAFTRHEPAGYEKVADHNPEHLGEFGYAHVHKCVICGTKRNYGFSESNPAAATEPLVPLKKVTIGGVEFTAADIKQ